MHPLCQHHVLTGNKIGDEGTNVLAAALPDLSEADHRYTPKDLATINADVTKIFVKALTDKTGLPKLTFEGRLIPRHALHASKGNLLAGRRSWVLILSLVSCLCV